MFVKKLVQKVTKKPEDYSESLKPEDVFPRITFHHGIPSSATMLAYDPLQHIVAVSTKNGLIKLMGKDNTQALLESSDTQPSKFLQFMSNQGVLLNVTSNNKIEVWNIDKMVLCHVHDFSEEVTSLAIMQHTCFILIGTSVGNVTIWKLDQDSFHLEKMEYHIPFSASHEKLSSSGNASDDTVASPVMCILPQPTAESKRILLIFADGLIVLWSIQESKAVSITGGSAAQLLSHEVKRVTSACWACPFGSKVVVGYSSGDILLYSILSNSKTGSSSSKGGDPCSPQNVHVTKLNLGYKLEKMPIALLKWVYSSAKSNLLYVVGASDAAFPNMVQVVLLNEDTENRIIKLGLHPPEPCVGLDIMSCSNQLGKHKQGFLLLVGKSGRIYAYDDHLIEKYVLQLQTKSSPTVPSESMIKLPLYSSKTTSAQFIRNHSNVLASADEDYISMAKNLPSCLPSEAKHFNPPNFTGFSTIKNLFITGHIDGTIKFWDVTCALFIPLLSLTQQREDDSSPSGVAVTAIYYCTESRILFSGDKSGMVCIYQFKPEPFAIESGFFSLPGSSKKGSNHAIHSVKYIKVNGPVISFNISSASKHLAVGCEQGHISLIDVGGPSVLYHKQIGTELCADVISLHFECSDIQGCPKNILAVATKDSSVLALDEDTGNTLSSRAVHPKKRSRALMMQILDTSKLGSTEDVMRKPKLLLLCSEKAAYIYSLPHAVQGEKKVSYKKGFPSSSCCWASMICSGSSIVVLLVFTCGKTEVRSLPELTLLKEATLKSFTHLPTDPDYYFCSSADGEVILTRSDQEIMVASVLVQEEAYRHLDILSEVCDKNLLASEGGPISSVHQKEKKKGIFGTVFKDVTESKTIQEAGDETPNIEEMSAIFSVSNFPAEDANVSLPDVDLDIDDIDLDDQDEKMKGQNVMGLLNKQRLASKFQSFKGKMKQMATRNERPSVQEEPLNEKAETLDQIKKKYGYSSSSDTSVARVVESKLNDNVKKLQGINMKTADMQDSAYSFSSLAKETLRTAEQKNNPGQI